MRGAGVRRTIRGVAASWTWAAAWASRTTQFPRGIPKQPNSRVTTRGEEVAPARERPGRFFGAPGTAHRLEVPMAGFLARLKARLLFNSSRIWLERYNREFSLTMRPGERVLDAGAGEAPYRPFFAHLDYESADFEMVDKPYARSTYVCDLCERIPVEDGRFNYVVFNQTLEHLKEPARALAELHRVLAPGG